MDIIIRKAKKSDVNEVYSIFLELVKSEDASSKRVSKCLMDLRQKKFGFTQSSKRELLREFRERNSIYLVAEINGKIVGYARGKFIENKDPFFKTVRIGLLNALAILKKYSRKGIASKLNKSIEKWFKKNKCSQIHLEVFENNSAIKIYPRWGYKTFINKMVKKL